MATEMWEWVAISILIATNALTLIWALKTRIRPTRQVMALQRAIAAFESQGQSILRIDRVNPDDVYLRSPGR